jgi:WD40 repeat protein
LLSGDGKNFEILNTFSGEISMKINAGILKDPGQIKMFNDDKTLLTSNIPAWNLANGTNNNIVHVGEVNNIGIKFTDGLKKKFYLTTLKNDFVRQIEETDMTGVNAPYVYPAVDGEYNIFNWGLSYDGRYVFNTCYIENTTNTKNLEIWNVTTHEKVAAIKSVIRGGAFEETKNIFVTKESDTIPTLDFFQVPSMKLLYQITDPLISKGADHFLFSNTDRYLVIIHDAGISIVEPATKKVFNIAERFADGYVSTYVFTPDDKFLVMGSSDGKMAFYNIAQKKYTPYKTIDFKLDIGLGGNGIEGITFSKNGKFIFVSCGDETIKIIDIETQTLLATLYSFPETNDWAVLTPEGHFDATVGAQDNMYYVKNINTIALADMYEKFYTPHLLTRILNGEKINKEEVDIDNIHPKPLIKIQYAEKTRNLEVGDDNPSYANTTGLAELTVNATAQDDKVDEIRLFHNGKIVNLTTRGLFVTDEKTGNETKKYTINLLPGQNTFRAIALNGQRTESKADEVSVNYTTNNKPVENKPLQNNRVAPVDAVDKTATLYLVVIGINKYQNPKLSLNYALADATAFKDEIEKDAKTVLGNVKTFFVTDNAADKKGITDALTEVQKNAKPQDVFLFYYAGHGYISEKTKEFYLVPTDVADIKNVDEVLLQKGISSKMLQTYAIDIPAQKQIFILDACQSAGAFEALLTSDANQQKSLAVVSRSTGTHWMAASGSKQFAQEFATLKHGAFTYVLLQALQGQAAANKMITVNGLKTFMQVQVPELMKKYNSSPQYPASYGLGNDFPVEVIK